MKWIRGQAMVEALALASVLAVALLVPLGTERPVASLLLEALISFLRAQAYVLSIV